MNYFEKNRTKEFNANCRMRDGNSEQFEEQLTG